MNYGMLISALVAFLTPIAAKKGVVIPPSFAGWISAAFVFIAGLVSNGVSDLRTSIVGALGGAVSGAASGFGADPGTQAALSGIILTVIGWLSHSPATTATPAKSE